MRLIWKPVRGSSGIGRPNAIANTHSELDALALEDEEEGASYLTDLNKVPDFVDEAPTELDEVRITNLAPYP